MLKFNKKSGRYFVEKHDCNKIETGIILKTTNKFIPKIVIVIHIKYPSVFSLVICRLKQIKTFV